MLSFQLLLFLSFFIFDSWFFAFFLIKIKNLIDHDFCFNKLGVVAFFFFLIVCFVCFVFFN